MKLRNAATFVLAPLSIIHIALGQGVLFPYRQNFDSVVPPSLPSGWTSTQNRSPGVNDFTTTSSVPLSPPNAVVSTNATISQSLSTPLFDFTGQIPDTLSFYTRRSSTHNANVVVVASLDGGRSFSVRIGDTLNNAGTTDYVRHAFVIPATIATSESVMFRWRTIADSTGTAGTFRLDDVGITVRTRDDLAITSLRFIPPRPVEGDTVRATAMVKNVGLRSASIFTVEFFLDANRDSVPEPSERMASVIYSSSLMVGDSSGVEVTVGAFPVGEYCIIAKVLYVIDQQPLNDQHIALVSVGYPRGSVVVNEIMYAPTDTEPEWVELYNIRRDSVNLKNWLVSDNIVTIMRTITGANVFIPPGSYVVLTKDSAALVDIHPVIPSPVVNVVGFPTLNNSGDAVVLYDNRSVTIDSVNYLPSWGGSAGGTSLERIAPLGESSTAANWGSSRAPGRSTPGLRNSLSRKEFDFRLDTVRIVPALPVATDSVHIAVIVRNIGTATGSPYTVSLYSDVNADSLPASSELIGSTMITTPLDPLDSTEYSYAIPPLRSGLHLFIATVFLANDEDITNNTRFVKITVAYAAGSVRINEIMYAPPSGIPEWVELVNVSSDTIDMNGWRVGNRSSSSRYAIAASRLHLPPFSYLVVAKDSALMRQAYRTIPGILVQIPALPTFLWNNNGDAVIVSDNKGSLIDSLFYFPTWGGLNGTSLERVDVLAPSQDPSNWMSAQDSLGATPGRRNSVVILDFDLRASRAPPVLVTPQTAAIIAVTVQNVGKRTSGPFALLFYDDRDRDSIGVQDELIVQLPVSDIIAPRDSIVLTYQWMNPSPGMHQVIAAVEYTPDERPSNNTLFVQVAVGFSVNAIVINEIMYSPLNDHAEYVEVLNRSDNAIDLGGWNLTDRPTTSGTFNQFSLATSPVVVPPGEFFVIASDSTLFTLFPSIDRQFVRVVNQSSLSLNNEGDGVVMRDPLGRAIDSVAFDPAWHNPGVSDHTGRSLERINPSLGSNDPRNWSTCANPVGGTPGARNSIFSPLQPSQSRLSVSPNPFSPDGDGVEDFAIIRYELPLQVSVIGITIYDVKGRMIRRLANNEPSGSVGEIVWDGRDDDKQKARIGLYVVLLEAVDERGGVLETAKGVVVLAAKL